MHILFLIVRGWFLWSRGRGWGWMALGGLSCLYRGSHFAQMDGVGSWSPSAEEIPRWFTSGHRGGPGRPQCASAFQAFACIPFAVVRLAKASTRIKRWENNLHFLKGRVAKSHHKGVFIQGREDLLWLFLQISTPQCFQFSVSFRNILKPFPDQSYTYL